MKKILWFVGVALLLLLAACSQSTPDAAVPAASTTMQLSADIEGSTVTAYSAVKLRADGIADAVTWEVSHSDARIVEADALGHQVTLLVPSADVGSLMVQARSAAGAEARLHLQVEAQQVEQRLVLLSEPSMLIHEPGTSRLIQARVLDRDNKPIDAAITFTSSRPDLIRVQAESAQDATVSVQASQASSAVVTARYQDLEVSTVVVFAELKPGVHYVAGDVINGMTENQITLRRNPHTEAIAVGDSLASDGTYGLSDRVVAIEEAGDTRVLTTEHVAPSDIYYALNTDVQVPVAHVEATLVGDGKGVLSSYTPGGELYAQTLIDSSRCTRADGQASDLSLDGTDITLTTDVMSDFQYYADGQGTSLFRLVLTTTTGLDITSGTMTFSDADGAEVRCRIDLGNDTVPVAQIHPFCLTVHYNSSIALHAKGEQAGGNLVVRNAFDASFNHKADSGVQYSRGSGWESISEVYDVTTDFTPITVDGLDVSKDFQHSVMANADYDFCVTVYKGYYTCCYYYYYGCYYVYNRRWVVRKVGAFDFVTLHSDAYLTLNNQVTDNYGQTCYTLDWEVGFNHVGQLYESLQTNSDKQEYSFNAFSYWWLGIPSMLEIGEDSSHSLHETFQGTLQTDCVDDVEVPY